MTEIVMLEHLDDPARDTHFNFLENDLFPTDDWTASKTKVGEELPEKEEQKQIKQFSLSDIPPFSWLGEIYDTVKYIFFALFAFAGVLLFAYMVYKIHYSTTVQSWYAERFGRQLAQNNRPFENYIQ